MAKKYGLNPKQAENWKNAYKEFGEVGLQPKQDKTVYSTHFKLNAVKLYLAEKKSYREIANDLQINNPSLITQWVLSYREKGELAFSKTLGRPKKRNELTKSLFNKQSDSSDIKQELAKLQNENLNLRMEHEYLKGLRRLRMEQQAKENPTCPKDLHRQYKFPLK